MATLKDRIRAAEEGKEVKGRDFMERFGILILLVVCLWILIGTPLLLVHWKETRELWAIILGFFPIACVLICMLAAFIADQYYTIKGID